MTTGASDEERLRRELRLYIFQSIDHVESCDYDGLVVRVVKIVQRLYAPISERAIRKEIAVMYGEGLIQESPRGRYLLTYEGCKAYTPIKGGDLSQFRW